ncbi:hypothetical protein vBSauCG_138 [Staphylococcus phage vB_Sau_CG]|nr:hypothetical protein vBSauCG_138 [Staphylococcus phage vB_Sau_CG]
MANKVYQLVFMNENESKKENTVYSDLDNIIYSLGVEGYTRTTGNLFKKIDIEGEESYVLIKEIDYYEGRLIPKDHVYLRDNKSEKPISLKLIRLLIELAYDDLTEQERRDLEIDVGSLALEYKKELEDRGEI